MSSIPLCLNCIFDTLLVVVGRTPQGTPGNPEQPDGTTALVLATEHAKNMTERNIEARCGIAARLPQTGGAQLFLCCLSHHTSTTTATSPAYTEVIAVGRLSHLHGFVLLLLPTSDAAPKAQSTSLSHGKLPASAKESSRRGQSPEAGAVRSPE